MRKEQYRIPARVSLIQVFFRDGTDARARADNLLSQFQKEEPSEAIPREAGDATTMLETVQEAVTALDLEKQFGTEFTAEVLALPAGKWSGPVRSGYGLHVVKVFDRKPGRIPDLAEVRDKVETDLQEVNFKYLEKNVKKYNTERQNFMRNMTRKNYSGKFK